MIRARYPRSFDLTFWSFAVFLITTALFMGLRLDADNDEAPDEVCEEADSNCPTIYQGGAG